jgi:hypothetical protein
MNISITFSTPIKARLHKDSKGVLLYLGVKRWLFHYGQLPKMKWFRIFGFTFTIGYWNIWPIEISITIQ